MRAYELRRGWAKRLGGGNLKALAASAFGSATEEAGKVVTSFGACTRLTAWTDGRSLFVDTEMNTSVPDDVARSTITAFNAFLEQATGYKTKERAKRAQQSAKAGQKETA
ncbi:MAG: hypothetical protein A3K65_04825 [Euryarchaeota archaeon RBG_16_68_12]|nr:MAG: hypothetical protein A3K65_04825 [Euryarchaeota archaeon RBG_16_68_12]